MRETGKRVRRVAFGSTIAGGVVMLAVAAQGIAGLDGTLKNASEQTPVVHEQRADPGHVKRDCPKPHRRPASSREI
jgi:hypothetical protein